VIVSTGTQAQQATKDLHTDITCIRSCYLLHLTMTTTIIKIKTRITFRLAVLHKFGQDYDYRCQFQVILLPVYDSKIFRYDYGTVLYLYVTYRYNAMY
jgi:hypothetical protein